MDDKKVVEVKKEQKLEKQTNYAIIALIIFGAIIVVLFLIDIIFLSRPQFNIFNIIRNNALNLILATGSFFLAIWTWKTSFSWYAFVSRFRELGISDAQPIKHGRLTDNNQKWLDRLNEYKEVNKKKVVEKSIVLIGTTLGGWFINHGYFYCKEVLDLMYKKSVSYEKMEVYIVFQEAIEQGRLSQSIPTERIKDIIESLKNINKFACEKYKEDVSLKLYDKINVLFYKSIVNIVSTEHKTFITHYLPGIPNEECPEIEIDTDGKYAEQFKKYMEKVKNDALALRVKSIEHMNEIIEQLENNLKKERGGEVSDK